MHKYITISVSYLNLLPLIESVAQYYTPHKIATEVHLYPQNQRKMVSNQARIQRGGSGGWNPPFFWPINAFEWEHIAGTPLYSGLGTPPF